MTVLVADDGSPGARQAVEAVGGLPLPPGSRVYVLGAIRPEAEAGQAALQTTLDASTLRLRHGFQFEDKGIQVESLLRRGHPAAVISQAAAELGCDLVAMGAQGLRAALGVFLGGIAQQVVEYASAPVWVARPPAYPQQQGEENQVETGMDKADETAAAVPARRRLQRAVFAVDSSPCSRSAAAFLSMPILPAGLELHLLTVLPPIPVEVSARAWLLGADAPLPALPASFDEAAAREREEAEARQLLDAVQAAVPGRPAAAAVVRRGDAATEILGYAQKIRADLIVCGSRGLSSLRGWMLGSVSRKLLHYAPCSVLVVKAGSCLAPE